MREWGRWRNPLIISALLLSVASFCSRATADETAADVSAVDVEATAFTEAPSSGPSRWEQRVDQIFKDYLVTPLARVLFFDFYSGPYVDADGVAHPGWLGGSVPFVVAWLALGAVFLTFRMGFINIRSFRHAIQVTRGDYDDPRDAGEVSHFQALSSALAATVGLGNIAGVAIAVSLGGPGAVFWMVMLGLFGMTSKFTECTLGQIYRHVAPDGRVTGGPMCYLRDGFRNSRFRTAGAALSLVFAVLCIGGSFGGGCAFQVSQSLNLVRAQLPTVERTLDGATQQVSILQDNEWIYGAVMMVLVGVVILGGIRRIAATAEKIVPLMCLLYLLGGAAILLLKASELPGVVATIVGEAFNLQSAYGGIVGVIVQGFRRAAFSNEAGCGSAAIAHAAAKTNHPVREGIVACLEPFIDTVVICTMTGLVIVATGVFDPAQFPHHERMIEQNLGAELTAAAFYQTFTWFPFVLTIAVVLFAYSTMISWSYYGERCATFLFGDRASFPYRCLFLVFIFLGAVVEAPNVMDFSDLMILSMAVPNMIGLVLLSGVVRRHLNDYWSAYRRGELPRYR